MIENEHQYKITQELLEKFENTLLCLHKIHKNNPILTAAYKKSLIYQIKNLKEQLKVYEQSER